MIKWNLVSTFYVLSVVSLIASILLLVFGYGWGIWLLVYGLVVPANFLLKYGMGTKGLWFFNDTVDGDFGDPKILKEYGHENKSKLFRFVWWWFRNHSWNFISEYNPPWNRGLAEDFRIIESTLIPLDATDHELRWTWCERKGVHGVHKIAARINGEVVCRYSEADAKKEKLFGAGGDRFKLKVRPVWQFLR